MIQVVVLNLLVYTVYVLGVLLVRYNLWEYLNAPIQAL